MSSATKRICFTMAAVFPLGQCHFFLFHFPSAACLPALRQRRSSHVVVSFPSQYIASFLQYFKIQSAICELIDFYYGQSFLYVSG